MRLLHQIVAGVALAWLFASHALAVEPREGVLVAPVVVDGELLMQVRGISAYPAESRARTIRERLLEIARDRSIDPASGTVSPNPDGFEIRIGGKRVVVVYPIDAELEEVPPEILAQTILEKMQLVVTQYRDDRTPRALLRSTGLFLGITAVAALLAWLCIALLGWINRVVERRVQRHIERLEQASHRLIHRGQIWTAIGLAARAVRLVSVIAIVLTWLSTACRSCPPATTVTRSSRKWCVPRISTHPRPSYL